MNFRTLNRCSLCNGYPASVIDNCIRSFLDKIFSPKLPVHSCSKKTLYFWLPYTGQHGLYNYVRNFVSYFHRLIHVYLFALSFVLRGDCLTFSIQGPNSFCIEIAFCVQIKVSMLWPLYVGETRRPIHTRISEHMGVSPKTGNKLSVSQMSAVLTHAPSFL